MMLPTTSPQQPLSTVKGNGINYTLTHCLKAKRKNHIVSSFAVFIDSFSPPSYMGELLMCIALAGLCFEKVSK